MELVGHHASLPLALAILYQDYPFALADLFLKRALALLAVVSIAFVAVATFGDRSAAFAEFIERDPREFALLMTLWVATALLYPAMRRATAWFVDTVLLRRPNYRALRASVSGAVQTTRRRSGSPVGGVRLSLARRSARRASRGKSWTISARTSSSDAW